MRKTLEKYKWEKHAKEPQTKEDIFWIFTDFHGVVQVQGNSNFINGVANPKIIMLKTLQIRIITNNIMITSNDNEQEVSQFCNMCSSDGHSYYVYVFIISQKKCVYIFLYDLTHFRIVFWLTTIKKWYQVSHLENLYKTKMCILMLLYSYSNEAYCGALNLNQIYWHL